MLFTVPRSRFHMHYIRDKIDKIDTGKSMIEEFRSIVKGIKEKASHPSN